MKTFADMTVSELCAFERRCACGRTHVSRTNRVDIAPGALGRLYDTLNRPKRVFLLCDEITHKIAGADVAAELARNGAAVIVKIIAGHEVHADELNLGRAFAALDKTCDHILAVGAGTLNDMARHISYISGIPFSCYGTAPSMDGFASVVTPLVVGGFKRTIDGVPAHAVVCEPETLAAAPGNMIAAGAGDVLAKLVALKDWALARDVTGEYHCQALADMMDKAVADVIAAAPGLVRRDLNAVALVAQALVRSGMGIQLATTSRPASGCEHHMSHFWEMALMSEGKPALLHGDKVGVGTLIAMDFWRRFFAVRRAPKPSALTETERKAAREAGIRESFGAIAPEVLIEADRVGHEAPANSREDRVARLTAQWDRYAAEARELSGRADEVRALILSLGGPVHPREFGIDKAGFIRALIWAKEVRPRYTILRAADDFGLLEDLARETADAWYD